MSHMIGLEIPQHEEFFHRMYFVKIHCTSISIIAFMPISFRSLWHSSFTNFVQHCTDIESQQWIVFNDKSSIDQFNDECLIITTLLNLFKINQNSTVMILYWVQFWETTKRPWMVHEMSKSLNHSYFMHHTNLM